MLELSKIGDAHRNRLHDLHRARQELPMLELALNLDLALAKITHLRFDLSDLFLERGIILSRVEPPLAGDRLLGDAELVKQFLDTSLLRRIGADAPRPLCAHPLGPFAQRGDVEQVHDAQAGHLLGDGLDVILKDKDIDL